MIIRGDFNSDLYYISSCARQVYGLTLDIVDPDVVCSSPLYSDRLVYDVIEYVFNDVNLQLMNKTS